MIVSTKGRYALRVMLSLAAEKPESYIPLKEIALAEEISLKYLEAIMSALSKGGFVDAVQGKGGGYRLSRAPEKYTVGGVLRGVEGNLTAVECSGASDGCPRAETCKARPVWEKLENMIESFLDGITLADLLKEH